MDPEQFFALLARIAPLELAESWDNVGILVEPLQARELRLVLLTLDLSEAVLSEAIALGADAVVSYHPPLFTPLKRLTLREPRERLALRLANAGMYIYSPHTALDVAVGGVNDWLAAGFDTNSVRAVRNVNPMPTQSADPRLGQGRLLELVQPITLSAAVELVKRHLQLEYLRVAPAASVNSIQTVALCAGSGASVLRGVTADLLLSGEMGHHDVLHANACGSSVILTEHSNSERGYLPILEARLTELCEGNVRIRCSKLDREPLSIL